MQQRAQSLAQAMGERCLGGRIDRLHRVVTRRFDKAIRPLGLSLPQMELLAVLMQRGALAPSALARTLAMERSTVSRNVAVMERNGWVAIDASPSGRARTVTITDEGVAILGGADEAWALAQSEVIELLGAEAPATIDSWLRLLAAPAKA